LKQVNRLPTKYTHTGQYSNMSEFGLMYYNARWYDPYLNRWAQPDTIIPDPGNPQDWDRYAYTRNNALKYTDPSGHMITCDLDSSWGCDGDPGITVLDIIYGGYNDTQEMLRGYIRHHPNYNPEFDNDAVNDRTIYSQVSIAMMQVSTEGTWTIDDWHSFASKTSTQFQDWAFAASSAGAGMEIGGTLFGGPEGFAAGNALHQAVTNPIEAAASWISTGITVLDDAYLTPNSGSYIDETGVLVIDETTATSISASIVGTFIPLATADAIIDGYASRFNYGETPGIYSLLGIRGVT